MKRMTMMAAAICLAACGAALMGQATGNGPLVMKGQTEPVAKVEVPAGMRGQLASVEVTQGQVVKKGDVLAKLDDAIQLQVVALAKLQADSTVEVRYAKSQEEFAKTEWEKYRTGNIGSSLERNQKELAVKQAGLVVEQYQEKQKQAAVKLREEEITLEHMTIKSPIDGFVLRVNKHAGEATDENPLVTVVQVNKLSAVFYPPKQMFGRVKVGDKVELEMATEPPAKREAVVVAVDPIIDPASQLFQVKMEVENADAKVPAGTGATWAVK